MAQDNKQKLESREDEIDVEKTADLSENKPTVKVEDEEFDLEKAIELTGFGKYHVGLVIICGLSLTSMVQETIGISFILPAAQCDLALTTSEKGYMSGMTFVGMVLSAHVWGFIADTFGRRRALLISVFPAWMFSFISSFAPTSTIFIAFRFLTGLFLCGTTSTVYAYLSEFLPTSNRSKIMTWTCGFIAAAYLSIPGIAWVLIPVDVSWDLGFVVFKSWRLFVMIMGLLSLVGGVVFIFFPESPKFLMSVGKKEETIKVLRYIHASNNGKNAETYPVKNLKFEAKLTKEGANDASYVSPRISMTPRGLGRIMWRQTAPLFGKPYGWRTLLFCLLHFGIYISSGGFYLWLPNLLNMMTTTNDNVTDESPGTICEFVSFHQRNTTSYSYRESTPANDTAECSNVIREEVYMSTLVVGAFYVVSYTTYGGLVSMFGKRNVLVSALGLAGIAGVGSYFARDDIPVTLLLSSYIVLSGTCISVLSAVVVDVYPTHLRAMAVSLALTCGRLGSAVAGNVIGILIESYCDFTIIGMGCITLTCALLCVFIKKL